MPATRKLEPNEIQDYFDTFTKHFLRHEATNLADVEVTSLDLGDQFEAEGVQLNGVTFDPGKNELDVMFEAGDHRVFKPSEVWVVEEPDGFVQAIEIVLADGVKEIIKVKRAALQPLDLSRQDKRGDEPVRSQLDSDGPRTTQ
jgi:hypothetical protein